MFACMIDLFVFAGCGFDLSVICGLVGCAVNSVVYLLFFLFVVGMVRVCLLVLL